ncbi:MAG: glucosamine-6-phosphate deaminase [Dysgonamonadaceae bacterium]|jgi:glucosamine-6-phosphate deaminase|nr:glucosamine-6-phosphate deaminase [Dysgonamonadaceae bacterium]
MRITIAKNEVEFDTIAAWRIIAEILLHPEAVIGLSTGQTTVNMHRMVGAMYRQHPFDVSGITLFGVDEVINVPREYSGACYTLLKTQITDALGIKEPQFLMPPTFSDDFERECRQYEAKLEARGGVDLQILGLGKNGHLGFNQPGTPFESVTWISCMDSALEARIRKETDTPPEQALGGFTLGLKNIMQSRRIILVAKGIEKAEIVREMLFGPVTTEVPASILQLHPNCEFLLDVDAAKYIHWG